MKVIIFGSRSMRWADYSLVGQTVEKSRFEITEVVCGMAQGADLMGGKWARESGIPIKCFPADWKTYGKSAGMVRNKQMGMYADAGIGLIWKGSIGSIHMVKVLDMLRKPHFTVWNGEIDYAF